MTGRGDPNWRSGLTVAFTFVALVAFPADRVGAGSVSTVPGPFPEIIYTGSASADNVSVDDAGTNSYTFAENGISAAAPCTLDTAPNPDVATCSGSNWSIIRMNLGAGDDALNASLVDNTIDAADQFIMDGEAGDDGNILGTSNSDTIVGGPNSDNSTATGLNGGAGNDIIIGGPNDTAGDEIVGGPGTDQAST